MPGRIEPSSMMATVSPAAAIIPIAVSGTMISNKTCNAARHLCSEAPLLPNSRSDHRAHARFRCFDKRVTPRCSLPQ